MSLIFYDTETTGLDPNFDQIVQFAAIKTDEQFNELDRFEIRCQLLPHIVPHPKAMLVTGISAEMLTDPILPTHYEMMCEIRKRLEEWSPSIFIGYNSLRFDEAFVRSAFYQTLNPIYLTNSHGNGRTDSLQLMQAATSFSPDLLNVPLNEKGNATFRLDQLAPVNGFAHEHAHDALADVEATIFMTKKVAEGSPDLWRRMRNSAEKRIVSNYIEKTDAFMLTEFFFNKGQSRFVAPVGHNFHNPSETLAVALDDKLDELMEADQPKLLKLLASSPRPVRRIRANASPIITSIETAQKYKDLAFPDLELLNQRISAVHEDAFFRERIIKTMADIQGPFEDDPDAEVEEKMYHGFYSRSDERRLSDFHDLPWGNRMKVVDEFEDDRLRILGKRLIYTHHPESLSQSDKFDFEQSISERFTRDEILPSWLTPDAAIKALDELLSEVGDLKEIELLNGLRTLYRQKRNAFSC